MMCDFDWIRHVSYTEQQEFIINLIDSCDKEPYEYGFLYTKDGEKYFYQTDENRIFWFDWDNVHSVLESKFGLNLQEQRDLIGGVLGRHYNFRGYTTGRVGMWSEITLERHYNFRGIVTM